LLCAGVRRKRKGWMEGRREGRRKEREGKGRERGNEGKEEKRGVGGRTTMWAAQSLWLQGSIG